MLELTDKQIAKIEQPHERTLWAQKYTVTPCFIRQALGNGDKLLGFTPLNTRPWYYVIRIDSNWGPPQSLREEADDTVMDHIDEIYDAIEEQCGSAEDSRSDWCEGDGPYPTKTPWPALDLDCGSSWWDYHLAGLERAQ